MYLTNDNIGFKCWLHHCFYECFFGTQGATILSELTKRIAMKLL
jgi:hypothetical protein